MGLPWQEDPAGSATDHAANGLISGSISGVATALAGIPQRLRQPASSTIDAAPPTPDSLMLVTAAVRQLRPPHRRSELPEIELRRGPAVDPATLPVDPRRRVERGTHKGRDVFGLSDATDRDARHLVPWHSVGSSKKRGTSTRPGPTASTRVPSGASSMASDRVIATSAPLVAE